MQAQFLAIVLLLYCVVCYVKIMAVLSFLLALYTISVTHVQQPSLREHLRKQIKYHNQICKQLSFIPSSLSANTATIITLKVHM